MEEETNCFSTSFIIYNTILLGLAYMNSSLLFLFFIPHLIDSFESMEWAKIDDGRHPRGHQIDARLPQQRWSDVHRSARRQRAAGGEFQRAPQRRSAQCLLRLLSHRRPTGGRKQGAALIAGC